MKVLSIFLRFYIHLKHILLGPIPKVSDSAGLEWNLRICISNFPGDVNNAALGTTFEKPSWAISKLHSSNVKACFFQGLKHLISTN